MASAREPDSGGLSTWAKGAILLLLAAAAVWAFRSCDSDERRLRRQLQELADLLAKDGEESTLVMAGKLRSVGSVFGEDFVVRASEYAGEIRDRRELAGVIQSYRSGTSTLDVSFSGLVVTLESGVSARGEAVARVRATIEGDPAVESYRLAFRWRRDDGDWKIQSVELLEVLEGTLFGRF